MEQKISPDKNLAEVLDLIEVIVTILKFTKV